MIKIEKKTGKRILIGGRDLRLDTYCNNDNVWFWYVYTKEEVVPGLFSKSGEYFKLFLKMDQKYPYSAYEGHMYCIYLGYKYYVENIYHGLFILYPDEHKTRRHLKLHPYDDRRIEVPYEEFIASSPIIWEERKPISDFVFDVERWSIYSKTIHTLKRICMVHGITKYQKRMLHGIFSTFSFSYG